MAASRPPASATREIPIDEPMLAGLTKTGQPSSFADPAGQAGVDLGLPEKEVASLGKPGRTQQRLGHALVHGRGRARHPGTAVRHAGHFQQTLHGAVLAHRPVQQRQHDQGPGAAAR